MASKYLHGWAFVQLVMDCLSSQEDPLSHHQFVEQYNDALAEIIVGDPHLQDLPTRVTGEEVQSQLALEHGQAITVNVRRADHTLLPIVVLHDASLFDLKRGIQRHYRLMQHRLASSAPHISWRYVWRRYWLYFTRQKMTDDKKLLKDYGIKDQDEVHFIKRLVQK